MYHKSKGGDCVFIEDGEPLVLYGVHRVKRKSCTDHRTPKRDFICMGYRLSGSADFYLADGAHRHVSEHCAVLIGNDTDYRQESSGEEVIAVHFDVIDGRKCDCIDVLHSENPKRFDKLFLGLLEAWEKKEPGFRSKCMSVLYEILRTAISDDFLPSLPEAIRKGTEYLRSNFSDSGLSVSSAAAVSCVSEVYFRRIFLRHFGIQPSRYIAALRTERAKELLRSGYYTVSETAELCGFSDQKYFSADFKRLTGFTPSEWKNAPPGTLTEERPYIF